MKPDLQTIPPARRNPARLPFLVVACPLLVAWGVGVVHPVLDWASLPGAWLAGFPAACGSVGLLGVVVLAGAVIATRAESHPLIQSRLRTTLGALGAVAALAVIAGGAAANRPASWLPVLLAWGVISRRGARTDGIDPWSVPERAMPVLVVALWGAAVRVPPWGDGLLPEPVNEQIARMVDAALVPVIPFLPLVPIGLLAALLARRAAPKRLGAVVGVILALALEKTFGSADHWVSMAALGAVLGAWPPDLFGGGLRRRPLVLVAVPVLVGIAMGGLRLGLTERWNCSAGTIAASTMEEFTFFHTESTGTSLAVVPSNLESLIVLRRGAVIEALRSGIVSGTTIVEPPGGVLVTPPRNEMPVARLVATDGGFRVEWWDPGSMQRTVVRDVDVDCTPVAGTMDVDTHRVWAVCGDTGRVVVVPKAGTEPEVWNVGGRPRVVELRLDALTLFGTGTRARGDVRRRVPDLPLLKRRSFGPWATGMAASPRGIAVGRGPAGHLQTFGPAPSEDAPPVDQTLAEELARSLESRTDSVRVGNWPGAPHRARIGDGQRGWFESMWVTSPVDARVTLVDLDATWHQRSVPVGAPLRSVWVNPDNGTLYGMNRCGVFSLRLRTTFPWDP